MDTDPQRNKNKNHQPAEPSVDQQLTIAPVKPKRFSFKRLAIVLGIFAALIGVFIAALVFFASFSLQNTPSDNHLNNQKHEYKKVLEQAANEASVGWMKEKEIDAEGCTLDWLYHRESCTFRAYLTYRNGNDIQKAKTQLAEKGWRTNDEEGATRDSGSLSYLGDFVKTIQGKLVCVSLYKSIEDGEAQASIDALNCTDLAKRKDEAYAGWTQYIPKNVPARYTYQRQSTPLYDGEIELTYRTAEDLSDDSVQNPMSIEIEEYKMNSAYDPPRHCPIIYSLQSDEKNSCSLSFTTPKGIAIYTSDEYNDPRYQYHYVRLDNTLIIIREGQTSQALTDSELVAFVDSLTVITPEALRKALPAAE